LTEVDSGGSKTSPVGTECVHTLTLFQKNVFDMFPILATKCANSRVVLL